MTVVKVQRPISGTLLDQCMIYDKLRARLEFKPFSCLPKSIRALFEAAPPQTQGRFKQYLDDAIWNEDQQTWNLSQVKPTTRRLSW